MIDTQALDAAVRRFPMVLRLARCYPDLDPTGWAWPIRFEYRRVLRERNTFHNCRFVGTGIPGFQGSWPQATQAAPQDPGSPAPQPPTIATSAPPRPPGAPPGPASAQARGACGGG